MSQTAGGGPGGEGGQPPPEPSPGPSALDVPAPVMTARLSATVLLLEAFAVFFGTLVAATLLPPEGRWSTAQVWVAGGLLALVCLLVSGLVRRRAGIALGWLVQGLLVASGVFVPAMFAVGIVFAALWAWLVSIGRRIDADRRRWAAQARR